MIGRLRGTPLEIADGVALVDVGGVGYEVEVTAAAAASLAAARDSARPAELSTHLVAREDAMALYGFANVAERDLFRSLVKVSGIGPKLAIALLSTVSPAQFAAAVGNGDVAAITRVPGIGKKTADRLVVELRDRVQALAAAPAGTSGDDASREAAMALMALGYRQTEAATMVGEAAETAGADAGVEELVTEALRRVAASA